MSSPTTVLNLLQFLHSIWTVKTQFIRKGSRRRQIDDDDNAANLLQDNNGKVCVPLRKTMGITASFKQGRGSL